jgi:hypothetical protein
LSPVNFIAAIRRANTLTLYFWKNEFATGDYGSNSTRDRRYFNIQSIVYGIFTNETTRTQINRYSAGLSTLRKQPEFPGLAIHPKEFATPHPQEACGGDKSGVQAGQCNHL